MMIQFVVCDSFYFDVTSLAGWFIPNGWYKYWPLIHFVSMLLVSRRDSFKSFDTNLTIMIHFSKMIQIHLSWFILFLWYNFNESDSFILRDTNPRAWFIWCSCYLSDGLIHSIRLVH